MAVVLEGTIHSSNTPHHRVQSSFQFLAAALHIKLSVSIVISGDIMRNSDQNPCEKIIQITQKTGYKLAGVLHKALVAVH